MADEEKDWQRRPDVERVIRRAVAEWHQDLEPAAIHALGRPKCSKKAGKVVWASIAKATPSERALVAHHADPPDYILTVGLDVWQKLPEETQLALIDHELSHAIGQDAKTGEWLVGGHDIEEFVGVIRRHGAWKADVERFIEAAQQVVLPQMTLDEQLAGHEGRAAANARAMAGEPHPDGDAAAGNGHASGAAGDVAPAVRAAVRRLKKTMREQGVTVEVSGHGIDQPAPGAAAAAEA